MIANRMWVGGTPAITIEMSTGKVGYIRCLTDPAQFPGDVEWACAIELHDDMTCKVKILNGKRGPTLAEVKQLIAYFKAQGYSGGWVRRKNGKPKKEVIIP